MRPLRIPEFICFLTLFGSLTVLLRNLFTGPECGLYVVLLLQLAILTISLDLSELTSAAFADQCDLPCLNRIDDCPSVAVLFLVCDDLVTTTLDRLGHQSYPHADIFILDDSKNPGTKRLLDAARFRIVRREDGTGYKAGSLNNWLRHYGSRYKYFVVLDSDSIIPSDFVERIVRYAEHPDNRHVAIFNTLQQCWNRHSRFARISSTLMPIQNWIRIRLANRNASVLSSGHNNLHRTEAILGVGGFDERFIAEDIAITLRLFRAGYTSKVVNLVAYEAEPENIFSYMGRMTRWVKQTVQIHRAEWRDMPLALRFQLFRLAGSYVGAFGYPLWAGLAAWSSTFLHGEIETTIAGVGLGGSAGLRALAPLGAAMILPALSLFPRVPLAIRLGIPLRDYFKTCLLLVAIGSYTMLAMCRAQIVAAATSRLMFCVTKKERHGVTFGSIIRHEWQLLPFWLVVVVGIWQKRGAFSFVDAWFIVLFCAPLIIFLFHDPGEILSEE